MAKCYYCGGAGCSQCRKMTKSSYGADAVAKAPSPNGASKPGTKTLYELAEKVLAKQKEIKHAWRSQQAARISRQVVYRGVDGSEVVCTFIGRSATESGTAWKDAVYVGEVTEYIRHA